MKRAFTLIELLVVIAIIAILAAILFPVFAQAKLQAKKISSLSNTKEVGLAELMYMNDADDNFVLGDNANCHANAAGNCTGLSMTQQIAHAIDANDPQTDTWVYITQPYIKNFGILVDPGVGDTGGLVVGNQSTRYNQDLFAQFGYNYLFLSPWWECVSSLSRNSSQAVHPANTVMFTSSQGFTTQPLQGWYDSNAPGAWPLTAPAPHACIWYDGSQGSGNWSANNPAAVGKITASTRAVKPYGGANVVWVDGHAKFGSDGYMATGTTYGTAAYTDGGFYGGGAIILNQANPTTYLWTLDGTLNDLVL